MAGKWTQLANQPPFNASTMLLLTNGTVLALEANGKQAWKLTPNATGDYKNGTWTQLASMHNTRLYFASAVLADGRVFVAGGEYSDAGSDTTKCEIYDPVLNMWSALTPPAGWTKVGDAPCAVLPDGRLILGNINTNSVAIFNPQNNSFSPASSKDDRSSEETWTLLPDESVLTVECANHPKVEKYLAAADKWVAAQSVPVELVQASSIEIGPAVLLPDGRVFAVGATGNTALYTPPSVADAAGTWSVGPVFPNDANGKPLQAKDAPGCLLPNGKVLCTAGPAAEGGTYGKPTRFFEYDPNSNKLAEITAPTNSTAEPYTGRMLLLPTGQVLYSNHSSTISIYNPDGEPDEDWRPEITDYPAHVRQKQSHVLHGRLLNGLSQACAYGDDATMATNYPIVRIRTHSGKVYYCRTFDHSTMGVATGLAIHSTHFKVPFGIEDGEAELCVVANGISSECVPISVGDYRVQFNVNEESVNRLIGSLADGPLWVLGPNGPHPVDPWGPDIAREAKAAWDQLFSAVKTIEGLGAKVEALQNEAVRPTEAPTLPHSKPEASK